MALYSTAVYHRPPLLIEVWLQNGPFGQEAVQAQALSGPVDSGATELSNQPSSSTSGPLPSNSDPLEGWSQVVSSRLVLSSGLPGSSIKAIHHKGLQIHSKLAFLCPFREGQLVS